MWISWTPQVLHLRRRHLKPPAPLELRRALTTIERILGDYVTDARSGTVAA